MVKRTLWLERNLIMIGLAVLTKQKAVNQRGSSLFAQRVEIMEEIKESVMNEAVHT